jgi:hypothetical protein
LLLRGLQKVRGEWAFGVPGLQCKAAAPAGGAGPGQGGLKKAGGADWKSGSFRAERFVEAAGTVVLIKPPGCRNWLIPTV